MVIFVQVHMYLEILRKVIDHRVGIGYSTPKLPPVCIPVDIRVIVSLHLHQHWEVIGPSNCCLSKGEQIGIS